MLIREGASECNLLDVFAAIYPIKSPTFDLAFRLSGRCVTCKFPIDSHYVDHNSYYASSVWRTCTFRTLQLLIVASAGIIVCMSTIPSGGLEQGSESHLLLPDQRSRLRDIDDMQRPTYRSEPFMVVSQGMHLSVSETP